MTQGVEYRNYYWWFAHTHLNSFYQVGVTVIPLLRVLLLTSANFSEDYHLTRSAWNLYLSSLNESHSQHLIAVRRHKSLVQVPVSCFRLCARELIYSAFSFMLQRFPNNYTQAGFHLKTILTSLLPFPALFLLSLKGSPNKSLAQGGNVSHFITLHFVTLHKHCTFLQIEDLWHWAILSALIFQQHLFTWPLSVPC